MNQKLAQVYIVTIQKYGPVFLLRMYYMEINSNKRLRTRRNLFYHDKMEQIHGIYKLWRRWSFSLSKEKNGKGIC